MLALLSFVRRIISGTVAPDFRSDLTSATLCGVSSGFLVRARLAMDTALVIVVLVGAVMLIDALR